MAVTPVGTAGAVVSVLDELLDTLDASTVVTDVAGVKGAIVATVTDSRFIGGHPMAGSELRGIDGARADLFRGCTWVLTPTDATSSATGGRTLRTDTLTELISSSSASTS